MKDISVIGLGYIGLPTAAMFAARGIRVHGVDVKKEVCEAVNNGEIHFEEPYLADLVKQAVLNKLLHCSVKVESASAYIIAVPTPLTADHKANLSYVVAAAKGIAKVLQKGQCVILESTVTPGCTQEVLQPILEKNGLIAGEDFYLAHCPERVLPGRILYELEHNHRVIGGINPESASVVKALYATFVKGDMVLTDTTTAELCKLMENTYRDVNIALSNELLKVCEALGCNVWEVIAIANRHPRVQLHQPGPGVGGHCIAVDPWFVVQAATSQTPLIQVARKINDSMPGYVQEKIQSMLAPPANIVILGCTYKPDVEDMRESPILKIAEGLAKNYHVTLVDPHVENLNQNIYEACNEADLLVLGVHHSQFLNLRFEVLRKVMRQCNLLDTRNYFKREELEKMGFCYYLLGGAS